MPIINTNVIEGPNVQSDGQHRGLIEYLFSDGRRVRKYARAPDATTWAALVVNLASSTEDAIIQNDAQESISPGATVAAHKEASIEDAAVAYLRAAWRIEQAYDAFLLFDKFNDFRIAKGWDLNQVQAGLMSAGLTVEEWDEMKIAYQYLAAGNRPVTMSDAKTIQGNWETR